MSKLVEFVLDKYINNNMHYVWGKYKEHIDVDNCKICHLISFIINSLNNSIIYMYGEYAYFILRVISQRIKLSI